MDNGRVTVCLWSMTDCNHPQRLVQAKRFFWRSKNVNVILCRLRVCACLLPQTLRASSAMEKRARAAEDQADKRAAELAGELSDTKERLRDVEVGLSSLRFFVFLEYLAQFVRGVFRS